MKSVEILQSLYVALETSSKHQLAFSTEDTEISQFFKSTFAIWTYFFNSLSADFRVTAFTSLLSRRFFPSFTSMNFSRISLLISTFRPTFKTDSFPHSTRFLMVFLPIPKRFPESLYTRTPPRLSLQSSFLPSTSLLLNCITQFCVY